MKKLNTLKMLEDINKLVDNDFIFSLECKLLPNAEKFTQKEAKTMMDILTSVYLISHCIHCKACSRKYR